MHSLRSKSRPKLVWDRVLSQPRDLVAELVLTLERSALERKVRISEWETSSGNPREQMYPNQTAVRLLPAQDLSEVVEESFPASVGAY